MAGNAIMSARMIKAIRIEVVMKFIQDIKEIRRELSYAVAHKKEGHDPKVVAVMLEVRILVDRTLNHLAESEDENEADSGVG